MGIDKSTLGLQHPSGCAVRTKTGDNRGGTTLRQNTDVAQKHYGVTFEVRVGANTCSPGYGARQLKAGRGIALQGNAGALLNTPFRSTNGPVNHAVWVNEGRGWDDDTPEECLVYDPAADGRRQGIAFSPDWWPWATVLKFAAYLEPAGDGTARLGYGRWYAAIGPDTEPHFHPRFGGVRSKPFPDRTRANAPKGRRVRVHSSPTKGQASTVDTLADGDLFTAYQYAKGDTYQGSSQWAGNHDGTLWVHSHWLTHLGGTT
jgi:hypothetical protein